MNSAFVGLLVGLGALIRFNLAVLGVAALFLAWRTHKTRLALRSALIITAVAGITIAPWVIRNMREFHGRVLLSSQTGYNMVRGLITPAARALPGDSAKLIRPEGWAQTQIETNDRSRLQYPDEGTLNSRSTRVAKEVWRKAGISAFLVVAKKLQYFWLETDQLTWFAGRRHLVRMLGVGVWWIVLACALAGWVQLRKKEGIAASALLPFAVVVTVFHVPFVMNARLGTPFLAPLASVLFPGGPMLWGPTFTAGCQRPPDLGFRTHQEGSPRKAEATYKADV